VLYEECPSRFYNFEDNVCVDACQENDFTLTSDIGTACSPTNDMCELFTPENVCVTSCESPYPLKNDRACVANCSGTNQFNHLGDCLETCPDKFFGDTDSNACVGCLSICQLCSGASICSQCVLGYFLEGTTCQTDCPDMKFKKPGDDPDFGGECVSCGENCLNCESETSCNVCMNGAALRDDKTCVVPLTVSECAANITNCETCNLYAECIDCLVGFDLIDGSCTPV
jgi:proprotein convertase subtilisin/kexin type 5